MQNQSIHWVLADNLLLGRFNGKIKLHEAECRQTTPLLRSADSGRSADCMRKNLMLPVGIESFEEIRKDGFYYIDKTKLIEQLLKNWGKVNLFTRPRRFGKTLNMSMLKNFFETGTNRSLFDGLYISQKKELCDTYMGKYPVIFLSLKDVDGLSYEDAADALTQIIGNEAGRFAFLLNSENLSEIKKNSFRALR